MPSTTGYKVTAKGKTFMRESDAARGRFIRIGGKDPQNQLTGDIRAIIVSTDIESGGGQKGGTRLKIINFTMGGGRTKQRATKAFNSAKTRGFIS